MVFLNPNLRFCVEKMTFSSKLLIFPKTYLIWLLLSPNMKKNFKTPIIMMILVENTIFDYVWYFFLMGWHVEVYFSKFRWVDMLNHKISNVRFLIIIILFVFIFMSRQAYFSKFGWIDMSNHKISKFRFLINIFYYLFFMPRHVETYFSKFRWVDMSNNKISNFDFWYFVIIILWVDMSRHIFRNFDESTSRIIKFYDFGFEKSFRKKCQQFLCFKRFFGFSIFFLKLYDSTRRRFFCFWFF